MNKKVTERDIRLPEFQDANLDDLEFRDDGKIVRKDRWERGIRHIAALLGISRSFEIDDIVSEITSSSLNSGAFNDLDYEWPEDDLKNIEVILKDGSYIKNVDFSSKSNCFKWFNSPNIEGMLDITESVACWREGK